MYTMKCWGKLSESQTYPVEKSKTNLEKEGRKKLKDNSTMSSSKRESKSKELVEVSNKRALIDYVQDASRVSQCSHFVHCSSLYSDMLRRCEDILEVLQEVKEIDEDQRNYASDLFRADTRMSYMIQFLARQSSTQAQFIKYEYKKFMKSSPSFG